MTTRAIEIPVETWHGCYDTRWEGLIVPEAFAHPAKFSRGLIERVVIQGLARGWWRTGMTIGDPFGGVALGGIVCGYHGLNWIGVELEEKFVELGNRNLALHGPKFVALGEASRVVLLQGDSRRFAEVVRASGIITSPPYISGGHHPDQTGSWNSNGGGQGMTRDEANYGATAGQIGQLKPGEIDAVLTSPPYADGGQGGGGDSHPDPERHGDNSNGGSLRHGYGRTPGQIGNCAPGPVDAVITSPPYAETAVEKNSTGIDIEKNWQTYRASGGGCSLEKYKAIQERHSVGYGASDGQIGALRSGEIDAVVTSPPYGDTQVGSGEGDRRGWRGYTDVGGGTSATPGRIDALPMAGGTAGETYWQAMHQVYRQCRLALRPGGVMAVVVKDYVKDRQVVPLCDQTLRLLEAVGFTPVVRIRAMLVKEERHCGLFNGEPIIRRKSRKSFFRRLAEKNGSPAIDFEEVLVVRADGG